MIPLHLCSSLLFSLLITKKGEVKRKEGGWGGEKGYEGRDRGKWKND